MISGAPTYIDTDSDDSEYDCVMPLGALEVSKPNAGPEAAGQPLSRGNEPDERVHGRNKGCQRDQKFRNEKRNMTEGQRRLRGYNDKTFRRHFKVIKRRFWQMAKEMAPRLELGDLGKLVALKSSGSWVPIECRLAVALRTLAGSNFQDKEDVYGVRRHMHGLRRLCLASGGRSERTLPLPFQTLRRANA